MWNPVLAVARRHPGAVVGAACFVVLASVLLAANGHLWSTAIREDGDAAANALIIEEAKGLDLLVGNYSRQGFFHPGPAVFYAAALAEGVLVDATGLLPAPANAHVVAVVVLNAALVALALAVLWSMTRSLGAVAAALGLVVAFGALHSPLLVNFWMPRVAFAPFLLLVVAAAAVAAGATAHLWVLALAGGLLVHANAAFLLFVPVTAAAAAAALVAGRRRRGDLAPIPRPHLARAAAVAGLFALPIVLNLVLHWPGEFGRYLGYGRSGPAGGHTLGEALAFTASFWPGRGALQLAMAVALVAGAAWSARAHPDPGTRRFLMAVLAVVGLETSTLVAYVLAGVDDLSLRYIGYFYWAAPLAAGLVAVAGLAGRLPPVRRPHLLLGAGGLAAVGVVLAGGWLSDSYRGARGLPAVVATLAARRSAGDQVLALEVDDRGEAWASAVAVLAEAERAGVGACFVDDRWRYVATARHVCSAAQRRAGLPVAFTEPGRVAVPLASLFYADITVGPGRRG